MPRLESVEDLKALRAELQQAAQEHAETTSVVTIGMGTCGIAAGARETLAALQKELAVRQVAADIVQVGCIGMCIHEPLLEIRQGGKARIIYANIGPERVGRLIDEHLIKGQPVKEWVVVRIPTEISGSEG